MASASGPGSGGLTASVVLLLVVTCPKLVGAELEECRRLFRRGDYARCIELADEALPSARPKHPWWRLKIEALMRQGRYRAAKVALQAARKGDPTNVALCLLGHEVHRRNGEPEQASRRLQDINRLVGRAPRRYTDVENLVVLGRAALLMGADPRQVLELFYDRAKREAPDHRETYLATGELALRKHDDALAAEAFVEGIKRFPDDPDLHFGLARAFASGNASKAEAALQRTLDINDRHVPALLFRVDHLIDSERYDDAKDLLARILSINPWQPDAWSYRAVLARLAGDRKHEITFRAMALRFWPGDPAVDHLIGRKLSQKYRFREGVEYQRRSLAFDEGYLPARLQLCQDLLRLGEETEGWQLAAEVHQRDGYDVVAYNLVNLRDGIAKFSTLRSGHFVVRMESREARVYGARVLDLLRRAESVLCPKYELTLDEPVVVEIFPDQSDFAVRTFGMPGGAGFLGVCFGAVITANSPASQGANPSNWEAVLWHEFCHVVTLQKTRNKMPRWLSEGISVYEEKQQNPAWGQTMTPRYRAMILDGELTPVSELSGAFLSPSSPLHLQFAYYESSLVVEFLVERFGLEALRGILDDLAFDMPINDALARHAGGSLARFTNDFEAFARGRAEQLTPEADWKRLDPIDPATDRAEYLADLVERVPNNLPALNAYAAILLERKQLTEAKQVLTHVIELYPGFVEAPHPYLMLAKAQRELGEREAERATLERLADIDADAVSAYLRLLELATSTAVNPSNDADTPSPDDASDASIGAVDRSAVLRNAERLLAVNPLLPDGHRYRALVAEQAGDQEKAVESLRSLLALDPVDPVRARFRLAKLLHERDPKAAKRHLLQALEDAPRFRAGMTLLLEWRRAEGNDAEGARAPVQDPRTSEGAAP